MITSTKKPFKKDLRVLHYSELGREVGHGDYAKVYKINNKQVVKVFNKKTSTSWEYVVLEIEGSKLKYALPIDEIVLVKFESNTYYGLVKKFVPKKPTRREMERFYKKVTGKHPLFWDLCRSNCGKTYGGKIYIIDTSLEPCG